MTTTTTTPMTVEQAIASVSAVLASLRAAEAAPHAAVNPDGTPGLVAAGELIESGWGNAVVQSNARTVLWKITDIGFPNDTALSATPWTFVQNVALPANPVRQVVIVTATIGIAKVTGNATHFDLYIGSASAGVSAGSERRVRFPVTAAAGGGDHGGTSLSAVLLVAPNSACTVAAQLACAAGNATASMIGTTSKLQVVSLPVNGLITVQP